MRRMIATAVAVALLIGYVHGNVPRLPVPDPAKPTIVLVALGDSITTAALTCPSFRCVDNSWATGTQVHSVYRRLRNAHPELNVQPVNLARPGAGSADLFAQATEAVPANASYVTVLIGANDACRWPMTDPHEFRGHVDDALRLLKHMRPRPRIDMISIPDVVHLYELTRGVPLATLAWRFRECPSLMDAVSSAAADVRRRRSIERRIAAYNRQLARACARYGHRCHWDRGRAHRIKFTRDMVGADGFHPSRRGQQALAGAPLPPGWTDV